MNNYLVRPYRVVIVLTNNVTSERKKSMQQANNLSFGKSIFSII